MIPKKLFTAKDAKDAKENKVQTLSSRSPTSLVYAVAHGMYIMAHGRAEASKLAPFIYTQLFGTVAAGWLFYSQVPQLYTALGAGLIALGGCIVLLHRPRSLSDSAPTNS